MHLIQDLDWIAPLLEAAKRRVDLKPFVYVTDRLVRVSPRVKRTLDLLSVEYRTVPYLTTLIGIGPSLSGFNALVTAAESSARPHAVAHRLTQRANQLGMGTYTLQHGIEQPGLTYFDETLTPDTVRFASSRILIWGRPDTGGLDPRVPEETRKRCAAVGWIRKYPGCLPVPEKSDLGKTVVLVSENLHRMRYDGIFRGRFVEGILEAASALPEVIFVIKPHHNQRWLGAHPDRRLSAYRNILLADSKDPRWEPYTASVLAAISDGVITTPSSVALDAAMAGSPTAVVDDGGSGMSRFEPLTHLAEPGEWTAFLRTALDPERRASEIEKASLFAAKTAVPGDAISRVIGFVSEDSLIQ